MQEKLKNPFTTIKTSPQGVLQVQQEKSGFLIFQIIFTPEIGLWEGG